MCLDRHRCPNIPTIPASEHPQDAFGWSARKLARKRNVNGSHDAVLQLLNDHVKERLRLPGLAGLAGLAVGGMGWGQGSWCSGLRPPWSTLVARDHVTGAATRDTMVKFSEVISRWPKFVKDILRLRKRSCRFSG
jgi:hypothetical protein